MELIILSNDNLERLGIVDSPMSVIWNKKYFTCGDFSAEVEASPYYIGLIKKNYFVIRQDVNNEIGIIETIIYTKDENNVNKIIFSGRFAQSLLARRVIWDNVLISGNLIEQLKSLIVVNGLDAKDGDGNSMPERNLISPIEKLALIGSKFTRKENAKIKLLSITGGIIVNSSGVGNNGNYLYNTPFDFSIDRSFKDVGLVLNCDGVDGYSFSFGEMVKNPFTNIADSVEIKGNAYIKKKNNVYIADLKNDLKRRAKSGIDSIDLLYKNSSSKVTREVIFGGTFGVVISEDGKDFGISIGECNGRLFSDKADIREIKDNSNDKYIYTAEIGDDTFIFFANCYNEYAYKYEYYKSTHPNTLHNLMCDDKQGSYYEWLNYMEKWTNDIQLIYTRKKTKEENTGFTVDMIPDSENVYYLNSGTGAIASSMMLEQTTENNTLENYLMLNAKSPETDAFLYEIVKGENLLEYVEKHLQNSGFGIKADYSRADNKIYFTFYSGKNRTRQQSENRQVVFSREIDSLVGYEITESTQGKNNVIRITGKTADADAWTQTGTSSGINRFETFEDVGELSTFSAVDYIKSLQATGEIALQGFSMVIGAEIDATMYKYRLDYDVGDLVSVDITDFSLQYNTRILEVCETYDDTGYRITLALGE